MASKDKKPRIEDSFEDGQEQRLWGDSVNSSSSAARSTF